MGFVETTSSDDSRRPRFAPQSRDTFLVMSVFIGHAAMTVGAALNRGYMRWNESENMPEFCAAAINARFRGVQQVSPIRPAIPPAEPTFGVTKASN